MPNKHLILIVLVICSALTLVGCADSTGPVPQNTHIAVVATSAVKPASELIFLDAEGQQLGSHELIHQGIFKIEQPNQSTLVLPVVYSNQILTLNLKKNTLTTKMTRKYPLFYKHLGNREFIIFNSDEHGDIDYLTYTLVEGTEEQTLRIKGFPLAMTTGIDTAYIYLEKNTEPDSILVLDLVKFSIAREIPLTTENLEGIRDMQLIGEQLYIPAALSNKLVSITLDGEDTLTAIPLDFPAPFLLLPSEEQVIVVHYTGEISYLETNTLKTVKTAHVPAYVITAQLHEEYLFMLVKEANAERKLLKFNLRSAQVEQTIKISHKPELLVQDFVVLN